jgi:hypothetical protein
LSARLAPAGLLLAVGLCMSQRAWADDRWVDDQQVVGAARARISVGYALGLLVYGTSGLSRVRDGDGLNVEQSVGLGHDLALGTRFGFRFRDTGRGLRADEAARGYETPTYGAGSGWISDPELTWRWRALHRRWIELSLSNRVGFPVSPENGLTEIVGASLSLHLERLARLDVGFDGVFGAQSQAGGAVSRIGFGAPTALWFNVTRGFFAGLVATPQVFAGTALTSGYLRFDSGVVAGYRMGPCDVMGTASLMDVTDETGTRIGLGVRVSCLFDARTKS